MSKIQSHAECIHENSKAARAKCRRQRVKFGNALTAMFAERAWLTVFQPEQLTIMSNDEVVKHDQWNSEGGAQEEPPEGPEITRENWKDYRGTEVMMEIATHGAAENNIVIGKITGWGEKKLRYQSGTGTMNMINTERVLSARAL